MQPERLAVGEVFDSPKIHMPWGASRENFLPLSAFRIEGKHPRVARSGAAQSQEGILLFQAHGLRELLVIGEHNPFVSVPKHHALFVCVVT